MSIVALKRKSAALYDKNHTKGDYFSLNGRLRFIGPGPVVLSKSVTRTPFKGLEPKGHGGGTKARVTGVKARSCGKHNYPVSIVDSGSCCIPQTDVKRSTMNTSGMLQNRYMGIYHGAYPKVWVTPPQLDHEQLLLLAKLAALRCQGNWPLGKVCNAKCTGTSNDCGLTCAKELNLLALDYQSYLDSIKGGCFKSSICHFPFRTNNSACATLYTKAEEARATYCGAN
jgi:hypothetical protein